MKNVWKIILAAMLVLTLLSFGVACSEEALVNEKDGGSESSSDSISDSESDDVADDIFDGGSNGIMTDGGNVSDNTSSDNS